jgi:hypothetical protein
MDQVFRWVYDTPLDELPRDEVRELLNNHAGALRELALAARRDHCAWLLPVEEEGATGLLLPEVQKLRDLGRLVTLEARLRIVEGRTDEAIQSLQTGFALARHTGESATLIHGLVGLAIAGVFNGEVEELIGQPGTPNLYWALTALPRPLVSLRAGMEQEQEFLYSELPLLRGVARRTLTAEQEEALKAGLVRLFAQADRKDFDLDAATVEAYPAAKARLMRDGHPASDVESMTPLHVVLADSVGTYEHLRDNLSKWLFVPYWQAREHVEEANRAATENREGLPLANTLLPALSRPVAARTRVDHNVAALRCVEAIRMYAAGNEGMLPEKLADITQVPVPDDPFTGEPFSYRVEAGTAILESAAREGIGPAYPAYATRYEIKIRR